MIITYSNGNIVDPCESLKNMILKSKNYIHVNAVLEYCHPDEMFRTVHDIGMEDKTDVDFVLECFHKEYPSILMPCIGWVLHLCIVQIHKNGCYVFAPCYMVEWGRYYGIEEKVERVVYAYQQSALCMHHK